MHLFEGCLTSQYYAAETAVFEKLYAFEVGIMGLGAGVQLDGWQFALQQAEVLDNGSIGTGVVKLVQHPHGVVYFVVEEKCVYCNKHTGMKEVGVSGQALYVLDGIASCNTGTESRGTDIYGIGTMVDGFATLFKVFGG